MNTENRNSEQPAETFVLFAWWRIAAVIIVGVAIIWGIVALVGVWGSPQGATGVATDRPAVEASIPEVAVPADERASAQKEAAPSADDTTLLPKEKTTPRSVTGQRFVEALMQPLTYELKGRFWGWRPNDLIRITDNVNNMQLGVLEVTRRAAVNLAERISRTGSASELNRHLESAMNLFMVKAESYIFPSAESSYKDGLAELEMYGRQLAEKRTKFYTRSDNLIPLLRSFANLLGSCDENLVKMTERDGSSVSTFAADDYFYYAKGVAGAMVPILEAVAVEFHEVLSSRGGDYTLKHAIHYCEHAAAPKPLIVLEGSLAGIFANHRANMASQISHGRFYLEVLANTLST